MTKKYNVNIIRHDLDRYPNISMTISGVHDAVVYDCAEYGGEFVSDCKMFENERDALRYFNDAKASTSWLSDNNAARGTIRVVGYTLEEVRYDDCGDVDTFCEIMGKFEPFIGYYKNEEEFWKDGNK